MTNPLDAPPPPPVDRERAKRTVLGPAIGLMATSAVGAIAAIANLFISDPADFLEMYRNVGVAEEQAQQMADIAAKAGPALSIAFIVLNALIFVGALQLMKLRGRGLAMTAAILSFVNCGSCCCVLSAPFGIWALIAMRRPDVQAAMEQPA